MEREEFTPEPAIPQIRSLKELNWQEPPADWQKARKLTKYPYANLPEAEPNPTPEEYSPESVLIISGGGVKGIEPNWLEALKRKRETNPNSVIILFSSSQLIGEDLAKAEAIRQATDLEVKVLKTYKESSEQGENVVLKTATGKQKVKFSTVDLASHTDQTEEEINAKLISIEDFTALEPEQIAGLYLIGGNQLRSGLKADIIYQGLRKKIRTAFQKGTAIWGTSAGAVLAGSINNQTIGKGNRIFVGRGLNLLPNSVITSHRLRLGRMSRAWILDQLYSDETHSTLSIAQDEGTSLIYRPHENTLEANKNSDQSGTNAIIVNHGKFTEIRDGEKVKL